MMTAVVDVAQRLRGRVSIITPPLVLLLWLQALTFYVVVDGQETYDVHICMLPGRYCCRDTVSETTSPSGNHYCSNFPIISTDKGITTQIGDEIVLYDAIDMCETDSFSSCHSGTTFEISVPTDEPAFELPIPISSPDDCKSPTKPICYSSNGRNCCANTVETFLSDDASVLYCSSEYQPDVTDIGSVCPCETDDYACLNDNVAVDDVPTIPFELPIPISSPDDCKSPTTPICYSSNGRNCCANTVQAFLSDDASVLYCSSEYQPDVTDIGSVCPCATDDYACLIDDVAVDDVPTISDIICEEEDFTTLCSLIETCPSIFGDDEMYTLFAPRDEAFVALDEMIPLDTLGEGTVCEILKFHVSEGGPSPIYSDDLVCESGDASLIGMMNDKNTRVKCTKDVPYGIKGGGNEEPANFVAVDLEAWNGVIHEIDTVLFFPSAIIKTNIEGVDTIPSLRDIP